MSTAPGKSTSSFCQVGPIDPPEVPTGWDSALSHTCSHLALRNTHAPLPWHSVIPWNHPPAVSQPIFHPFKIYSVGVITKPLCPPFCGGHGNPLGSPIKCPSLGLRQSQVWLSPPIVRRRASYSQSSLQRTSLHKFSLISKNPTVSTPDVNVYLRERKLVF